MVVDVQLPHSSFQHEVRNVSNFPAIMVQDALAELLEHDPDKALAAAKELRTTNWLSHPVRAEAIAAGDIPVPYGIFQDGTTWRGKGAGTRESVYCYYVSLAGSKKNHRRSVFIFRKDWACGESCGCPCKGRCTFNAFEHFLSWQVNWAADGRAPPTAYQGFPWTQKQRQLRAGSPRVQLQGKTVRFCLVEFRHDWDALSYAFGFPRPNQNLFCPFCPCLRDDMREPLAQTPYTHTSFMELLKPSALCLEVGEADLRSIFSSLKVDHRQDGMRGVVICKQKLDVFNLRSNAVFQLQLHDRLEIGGSLWDPYWSVEEVLLRCPGQSFTLHFWRRSASHRFSFLSPLLSAKGVTYEMLMLGTLHTLDLGVTARLNGFAMIAMLKAGTVFGNGKDLKGMGLGINKLSAQMRSWQRSPLVRKTLGKKRAFMQRLTLKMLCYKSPRSTGHLKSKAIESRQLLLFVYRLLSRRSARSIPGRKHLVKAARSLIQVYNHMRLRDRNVDSDKLERLLGQVCASCKKAKMPLLPKHHLAQHFGLLSRRAGNPEFFSEFQDETYNALIVRLAQAIRRPDFAARIYVREHLLQRLLHRA